MPVIQTLIRKSDLLQQTLLDPVSKFRVSQPETLIDTDFEYGLQSTKWETLELVNNIPSFFSRSGDEDLPVSNVTSTANSFKINVTFSSPHSLTVGTPIIIYGLNSITAEGSYFVMAVPDANTISYRAKEIQYDTKSLYDQYATTMYVGRIYQGTQYSLDNIISMSTDAAQLSKIIVQTKYPHGFSLGTRFNLINSIGRKRINADASLVDPNNTINQTLDIITTGTSPDGSGFTAGTIIPYDWQGKRNLFFSPSANVNGNNVSITNHNLTTGMNVMYVVPPGDTPIGGLNNYNVYSVTRVDVNAFSLNTVTTPYVNGLFFKLYNQGYMNNNVAFFEGLTPPLTGVITALSSIQSIGSGYNENSANFSIEMLGWFRPQQTGSWTFNLSSGDCSFMWLGSNAISGFATTNATINNAGIHAEVTVSATLSLTSNVAYPLRIQYGASAATNQLRLSFSGPGRATTNDMTGYFFTKNALTGYTITPAVLNKEAATAVYGQHAFVKCFLVTGVSQAADTVTINMSTSNFTDSPLRRRDPLVMFAQDTERGFGVENITPSFDNVSSSAYSRFFVNNTVVVGATSTILQVSTSPGGSTRNLTVDRIYGPTWIVPITNINDYDSFYYPNHGLALNDPVTYSVVSGTGPNTLSNITYFVDRVNDDQFRIKTSTVGSPMDIQTFGNGTIRFAKTVLNPNADTIFASGHELFDNVEVEYDANGNTPIPGLTQGSRYYVYGTTFNRFKLASQVSPVVVPVNITGTSGGTHYFYSTDKATDGAYSIGSITDTYTFTIDAPFNIPFTSFSFNPKTRVVISDSGFLIPTHRQRTGSEVQYSANSNTPIGGLIDGSNYYVIRKDLTYFQLASSYSNALVGSNIMIDSFGSGSNHTLNFKTVCGEINEENMINLSRTSNMITANTGVDFMTTIKLGDTFRCEVQNQTYFNAITAVNTTTEVVTVDSNIGLVTTTPVLYIDSNPIGPLFESGTTYYARSTTMPNQFTLHPTALDALNNTNLMNVTSNNATGRVLPTTCHNAYTYNVINASTLQSNVTLNKNHNYYDGMYILYEAASAPIQGLSNNTHYFVRTTGFAQNVISLHTSIANVVNNIRVAIGSNATGNITANKIFLGSATQPTTIDATADVITLPLTHGWQDGDLVIYEAQSNVMPGLSNGYIYYVGINNLNSNQVALYETRNDALLGTNRVDLTATTPTGGMLIRRKMDTIFESIVTEIKNSSTLLVSDSAPYTTTAANYMAYTGLYPRTDGYSMHRPYDGGVEIIPSMNPDSQIIRQTRKYFRYQSGKGIQVSKAVNFNAPTQIDLLTRSGTTATAKTKRPHRLTPGNVITISGAYQSDINTEYWNGTYTILSIPDSLTFIFTLSVIPQETIAGGVPVFVVQSWLNSYMRVGMFDDQNGIFYEYDGMSLSCVRRNSTLQLPGTVAVTFNSALVMGTNTRFTTILVVGDYIVIKGQSYKVVFISNDNTLFIQPPYRGISYDNVVITKTTDRKVARPFWSIDKCDGQGPTGYNIDLTKIQMVYIDYSWYGAGKVRFGFKTTEGEVRYVHEFIHNNNETEAYLRSGNLPGRYEVASRGVPTFVPSLMHWGTSIIMDGRFDDDKAYLFTGAGSVISYGGGDVATFTATITFPNDMNTTYIRYDSSQGRNVSCFRITANVYTQVQNIRPGTILTTISTNPTLKPNTKVVVVEKSGTVGFVFITLAPSGTVTSNAVSMTAGDALADQLPSLLPLISIRLSPSVDNSRPGVLGSREIINRMQIVLNSVGILTTNDCEISLLLNAYPYSKSWQRVTPPSLSQLIYHAKNDTITGGTQIYSFRVAGGTTDSTGKRTSVLTTTSLTDLITLGNAIVAGDDVYPNGPDILTVTARVLDTSGISTSSPFTVTGRITWTESQA
jgi:hypothetical protein